MIQDTGTSTIELDFNKLTINSSSVLYIHPSQVHRILNTEDVSMVYLILNNEHINPEYLVLSEELRTKEPLELDPGKWDIMKHAVNLCLYSFNQKREHIYWPLLKDNCNALAGLILSEYLKELKPFENISRFEIIAKSFHVALEQNFMSVKRPAAYAELLNISVPYLNECIKNATGNPVSYHIIQRCILEAKRMLFHSQKSVKEIASELGYEDYAYFSRLFKKTAGMTALAFRHQNLD
ncbi:AraC family transcriptional regulator [Chryseobacterium shandongense]|nr:AraC family transcriptional regulator [Chryseobacterium shandongense]